MRYAGEFGGIRVAAGIGYQNVDVPGFSTPSQLDNPFIRATDEWSASLALMHVASGLFAQGHYARSDYDQFATSPEGTFWLVQAGITKNWFGPGNTSFYGEYGEANDFAQAVFPAITSSDVTFFGLGVVQQIDAAAMELYLGWRRFETDLNGVAQNDLDLVQGGARIRF